MYNGGVGGSTTLETMFRQGCIKVKFNEDYTLTYPETSTGMSTVSLEDNPAVNEVPMSYFRTSSFANKYVNPCTVNGIKCQVTASSVKPLEACTDVPGGWISSNGSTISPNVDVNVYYIYANGGYNNMEQLLAQQQLMVDYGSEQYIILAPHRSLKELTRVDETFVNRMRALFGEHVLFLNKEIRLRAAELCWRAGVYDSIVDYYLDAGNEDRNYVSQGKIPRSLLMDDLHHPNEYGCKVFAMLIHDKMVSLGYLDDAYILSTGADLYYSSVRPR